MKIFPLGHTETLLEIESRDGSLLRILVDSWLSDTSPADLMERNPKIRIDWKNFPKIDAVYISHSHLDHLDPYFLSELYQQQGGFDILLPNTLRGIGNILSSYLPQTKIFFLGKQILDWRGIEICGIRFEQESLSNEEEVLALGIRNQKEAFLFEVDAPILPTEEHFTLLQNFFDTREKNMLLLARNDLEYFLPLFDCKTKREAEEFLESAQNEVRENIHWFLGEISELPKHITKFFRKNHLQIGLIGGGLCFPKKIHEGNGLIHIHFNSLREEIFQECFRDLDWNCRVLKTIYGKDLLDKKTELGGITFVEKVDSHTQIDSFEPFKRKFAPLRKRELPENWEEILLVSLKRFRDILYTHDICSVLARAEGGVGNPLEYRMVFRKSETDIQWYSAIITPEEILFRKDSESLHENDEDYWLEDVFDIFDGKTDMYANFCVKLDAKKSYRYWVYLGMNFLHPEILEKKCRYHFEQAKKISYAPILWAYEKES